MSDLEKKYLFDVIEGGLNSKELKNEQSKREIAGINLAAEYEIIISKADIKEDKIFEVKEIVEIIKKIAQTEGFNEDYLEIVQEERNQHGDLLSLVVGFKFSKLNTVQRSKHIDKSVYHYIVKSDQHIFTVDETTINKGYMGIDDDEFEYDELPDNGKVLAKYNSKWHYNLDKK